MLVPSVGALGIHTVDAVVIRKEGLALTVEVLKGHVYGLNGYGIMLKDDRGVKLGDIPLKYRVLTSTMNGLNFYVPLAELIEFGNNL